MKKNHNPKNLGKTGENLAANLLKSKNYEILATNLVTPVGEIDILAREGSIIVIVEVKTKSSADYGMAAEMVTKTKQEKLTLLGKVMEQQFPNAEFRFDVVAIDYEGSHPHIEHIINAFESRF